MLDISMFNNQTVYTALYLLFGFPLMGLWCYMFDQVKKSKPQEDSKDDLASFCKTLFKFFYLAPFQYLYMSIKKRDIKGIIVSILTAILLVFAFSIGDLIAEAGK